MVYTLLFCFPVSIDDSAAQKLQAKSRLLCWVPSTESRLSDKVKAVNETWLQRCDGRVIFVNTKQPNPDVIRLDVPEGRQHLTAKSVAALVYLYKHYLHDFDWFLKADDDAYIIVENLRFLLSHYNHSAPVYLGHLYKGYHKAGYMSGGASYVISREVLRLANEDGYQKVIGSFCTLSIPSIQNNFGDPRNTISRSTYLCFIVIIIFLVIIFIINHQNHRHHHIIL